VLHRNLVRLLPLVLAVAACNRGAAPPQDANAPLEVAATSTVVLDSALLQSGPQFSGTLVPDRAAQLRAQVAGPVLALYAEEGSPVTAGMPVALIDTTTLAEAARSAHSQLASAQLGADVAKRNYDRSVTLHNAGAIADRDLETAHNQSAMADAAVADATSKLATAEKQLANAVVRAPFAGVVSERPASTGDVLQVGALILTVVDPTVLRLEASVAAEYLAAVHVGTRVAFTVNGDSTHYHEARVARINPAVDSVTRQVRLYISVPNADRSLATGLFAEGRVTVAERRALALPLDAIDRTTSTPSVRRVRGGKVAVIPVTLGLRDEVAERVEVTGAVARGDTLLIGAALTTPAGAVVRITHADR
jgi:RND family efflux transporter MFP subunit